MTKRNGLPNKKHGRPVGLRLATARPPIAELWRIHLVMTFASRHGPRDMRAGGTERRPSIAAAAREAGLPYERTRWYLRGNLPRAYVEAVERGDDLAPPPKAKYTPHVYVPTWAETYLPEKEEKRDGR